MWGDLPGRSNTISNSSTIRGWLESTGLDDLLMSTCSCIFGDAEPPQPLPGERKVMCRGGRGGTSTQHHDKGSRRHKRVIKAGNTVDGTPLVIEESLSGIFGMLPVFGDNFG